MRGIASRSNRELRPNQQRIKTIRTRGETFRRAEVPFKSAQATHLGRPTGLADGLELESTPTRIGKSAPRYLQCKYVGFPGPAPFSAGLGYTTISLALAALRKSQNRAETYQENIK